MRALIWCADKKYWLVWEQKHLELVRFFNRRFYKGRSKLQHRVSANVSSSMSDMMHWFFVSSSRMCPQRLPQGVSIVLKWMQKLAVTTQVSTNEWIQDLIPRCCIDIESCKGEKFRIWQKSGHIFGNTSLMSDMFLVCMLLVKGCQTLARLGNGPNKPTATIIGEYSASFSHWKMVHWYWVLVL